MQTETQNAGKRLAGARGSTAILAHRDGISLMIQLLLYLGAMCPKCAFGTRAISKKWAKCKKCGDKVERRTLPSNTLVSDGTNHK